MPMPSLRHLNSEGRDKPFVVKHALYAPEP